MTRYRTRGQADPSHISLDSGRRAEQFDTLHLGLGYLCPWIRDPTVATARPEARDRSVGYQSVQLDVLGPTIYDSGHSVHGFGSCLKNISIINYKEM